MGSLKNCCPLTGSLSGNVGWEKGRNSTLSKAPFVGQEIEAQRGEAAGPRSHSGTGAQQGIKSVWSRS